MNWGYAGQVVTTVIIVLLLLFVFASLVGAFVGRVSRSYPDPENAAVLERQREALIVADAIEHNRHRSALRVERLSDGFVRISNRTDDTPPRAA